MFLREATDSEADIIESHRLAAAQEAQNFRGTVQNSTTSSSSLSYVAGYGNTVMASLVVSITSNNAQIDHVYVVPEAREVGLADALVQFLLTELRERDITYVGAQALPGDRSMKNLFERHGLIAQTIIVGKTL